MELVSRFARRDGPSNAGLRAASMPPGLRAAPLRDAAADVPPLVSLDIREDDRNGVGLLYSASFLRFFAAAEAVATAPMPVPPVRRREVHSYGNADVGDGLDVACDLLVPEVASDPVVVADLTARRRCDGALVATCEVRRGGA